MKSRDKDHKLKVSITYGDHTTEDVLCEVYLPKRVIEPVELIFRPTFEQSKQLGWPFEFSIYGEIKDFSGDLDIIIKANKVYYKHGTTEHWGHGLSESILIGEPIDLIIMRFLSSDGKSEKEKTSIKGTFWLTPNIMLSPTKILSRDFTGKTTVDNIHNFEFALENGYSLKFDHHYRYLENDAGDTVFFPELVAEFEIDNESNEIISSFEPIDDFLMLTSFSARQRCACLGWEMYGSSKITKFYRRDIAIPKIKKDHSSNDTLIDIEDFKDFIGIAYKSFIQTKQKELLRQAVYKAIGGGNTTLENDYLSLYSALENIVLLYRKNREMESIIPSAGWITFENEIKGFIKNCFSGEKHKEKRKLIYEKLPELNRVSFSTVFTDFCEHYNVDLQDLWPVIDRKEGISLSDIRHKLVHGDIFNRRQQRALISAREHLRWVVERSILSVLGWTHSKSKVSQNFLSKNKTMYREWDKVSGQNISF